MTVISEVALIITGVRVATVIHAVSKKAPTGTPVVTAIYANTGHLISHKPQHKRKLVPGRCSAWIHAIRGAAIMLLDKQYCDYEVHVCRSPKECVLA